MKILFIAGHEFLYKPQNGGQKCSLRNYKLLSEIVGSENIHLIMFSNHTFTSLPENIKIFPTQKSKWELIKNTTSLRNVCSRKVQIEVLKYIQTLDYDILFMDSSTIGSWLKRIGNKKLSIVFFHNIEKNYAWNKVIHENPGFLIAYMSYWYNEKMAIQLGTKIIALNERDSHLMQKTYKRSSDFLLPISFHDTFNPQKSLEDFSSTKELLFVGTFFKPNVDGVKWFVQNVMPKLPTFTLKIVGKGLEILKNTLSTFNVEVIGSVDDLDPYYYSADAIILPIFYGDGMKVKTAEAMMYGKTIFATNEALEGYITQNSNDIFRCNSAEDFITSINEYFTQNVYYKTSKSNRSLFLQNYETGVLKVSLTKFIEEMC